MAKPKRIATGVWEADLSRSSNLNSATWSKADGTLDVVFKNGNCYRYHAVPRDRFNDLASADSPGRFLLQSIRPVFRAMRLADIEPSRPQTDDEDDWQDEEPVRVAPRSSALREMIEREREHRKGALG